MSIVKILEAPDDRLLKKSVEVKQPDKDLRDLLMNLYDTLEAQNDPPGVGLSAPQIGMLKRVFLARIAGTEIPTIFINPSIKGIAKQMSDRKETRDFLEGCLSIPRLYGEVVRPIWVELEYWTLSWKQVRRNQLEWTRQVQKLEGLDGRVTQHEFDHLEGILFTQRTLEQGGDIFQVEKEGDEDVLVRVEV